MGDEEEKRLRRTLYATIIACSLFIISFGFYVRYQLKLDSQLNSLATQVEELKQQEFERPHDGLDGVTPVLGVDYFNGVDGKDGKNGKDGKDSASTNTIIQQPIITNTPVPGATGKNGRNGREIELCYMDDGVTLGQRFVGNEECQDIEKP